MKHIHMKFQHKLIWYNFIVFMLIILSAAGCFFYYMAMDLKRQAYHDFETLANKTTMQLNTLVYNMDKTAVQIAANPNIVKWFLSIPADYRGNYFIEEPIVAQNVVQLLNSYNFKKDGNSRILLYNDNGDFVYSATTMTTSEPIRRYLESRDFSDVRLYFESGSVYSYFRPPMEDNLNDSGLPSPAYFSTIRQIKDYSLNSQKCGYVEVQQSVSQMDAIFGDIGSGCYAALFDRDGNIIYRSPGLRDAGKEQNYAFETLNSPEQGGGMNGGEAWRWWSGEIQEAPVKVVFLMENRELNRSLFQFGSILLGALLVTMAATIVSEILLIRHLSRPLAELQHSIKAVRLENLRFDLQNDGGSDELQQINKAFNKMLQQLQSAIDRQLVSETNELKSHLFALQSQMNPHFIHNLLAIISMEANMDGNKKIITICSRLSKMLNFSSSMGNGFCSLSAEMEHTENYLRLMKERYEDLFEYELILPDDAKWTEIPKLIIQPLCENCFAHAFKYCRHIWQIRIEASVSGDGWQVDIQDNGPGFPEAFLKEYETLVRSAAVENVRSVLEHLAIGGLSITNIYMRLKIAYGDNAFFTIENTKNGAKITMGRREQADV